MGSTERGEKKGRRQLQIGTRRMQFRRQIGKCFSLGCSEKLEFSFLGREGKGSVWDARKRRIQFVSRKCKGSV